MGAASLNPRKVLAVGSCRAPLCLLALLASSSPAPGQVFRTAPVYEAGSHPIALVAADLDGDQRIDLAVANGSSQDVSILLGDGNGAFDGRGVVSGLLGLSSLAAGDFDRDGHVDLVASTTTATRIYRNDGAGGFGVFAECGRGGAVSVTDVDGDGLLDVVGAAGAQAWVARGNGAGGCGAADVYGAGVDASALAVADTNGDARPELLVADRAMHGLVLLRNLGDGTFGAAVTVPLGPGTYPSDVAPADFDRDGHTDVAVAAPGTEEIVRLAGDGSGGLVVAQRVPVGALVDALAAADLDADGWPDLLAADAGAGDVLPLRNHSGQLQPTAAGFAAGHGTCDLGLGDFDGDGHVDAAAVNRGGVSDEGGVAILIGDGRGGFPAAATTWLVDRHPLALAAADLDGEDGLDLVTANQLSGSLSLLRGGTAGGFAPAVSLVVSDDARDVAVADFDRDGWSDLAAAHFTGNGVSLLRGIGNGGFAPPITFAAANKPLSLTATDVDGNGNADLAVVGWGQDAVAILLGDGRGGFRRGADATVGHEPHDVDAADLDRDGHADLAVANWGSGSVSVLRGDGAGGFALALSLPAGPQTAAVAAEDVDGDGLLDLLAGNQGLMESGGTVSLWRGDGAGGFSSPESHDVGRGPYAVALADLDLDGRLDVATANAFDHTVSLLVGSPGGLGRRHDVPVGHAPTAVVARDLDGDGRIDLAVTSTPAGRGRVLVLRNETPAADLAVTVDDGAAEVRPGDSLTYAITVTNRGPVAVTSLVVHAEPGAALQDVAYATSAGAYDPATGAWSGFELRTGQDVVLTLRGTLDPMATGVLVQEAAVSGPPGLPDPQPLNNSGSDVDRILAAADLALSASAAPDPVVFGDVLTYAVRVSNHGPLIAEDAVLALQLPTALTFEPSPASPPACAEADGRVSCALGSLPAGTTTTLRLRTRAQRELSASSLLSVGSPTHDPDLPNGRTIVTTSILPLFGRELSHGSEARGHTDGGDVWFRLRQAPRASYEIVVDEAPLKALRLERMASDLRSPLALARHEDGALRLRLQNLTGEAIDAEAIRIASVGAREDVAYRVRAYETTGRFPRFNDEGHSSTIVVLQNVGAGHVQGALWFWDTAGALLAVRPFELAPRATSAFDANDSVAGRSGSITVTHDAPHGGLAGKAVMVDPATGFVSESAMTVRDR